VGWNFQHHPLVKGFSLLEVSQSEWK
jgi:hypothetical protein